MPSENTNDKKRQYSQHKNLWRGWIELMEIYTK